VKKARVVPPVRETAGGFYAAVDGIEGPGKRGAERRGSRKAHRKGEATTGGEALAPEEVDKGGEL